MNKKNRLWMSARGSYGIAILMIALLFSPALQAQETKKPPKTVTDQKPARTEQVQPPRQIQQQPRLDPVRPPTVQPKTVRPDEPVKQQPIQVNNQPAVSPVRPKTVQPVPVNPVKDEQQIAQPDAPVKEPGIQNNVPDIVPVKPKVIKPKQEILVDQAPAQEGINPAQANVPVVIPPIRVSPPPPNNVMPSYDPRNPNWRYSHLPRRHSHIYYLPSGCQTIYFGNYYYRYYNGLFYQPFDNYFMVISAPFGIYIDLLPFGYSMFYVNRHPYFYYNGNYFDYRNDYYYVVPPPVGALIESLPDNYTTMIIDGETYYEADGVQYKPEVQENGEIWFRVIKSKR